MHERDMPDMHRPAGLDRLRPRRGRRTGRRGVRGRLPPLNGSGAGKGRQLRVQVVGVRREPAAVPQPGGDREEAVRGGGHGRLLATDLPPSAWPGIFAAGGYIHVLREQPLGV